LAPHAPLEVDSAVSIHSMDFDRRTGPPKLNCL
jgi:hypothetical protein